jgi:hypothetical protein
LWPIISTVFSLHVGMGLLVFVTICAPCSFTMPTPAICGNKNLHWRSGYTRLVVLSPSFFFDATWSASAERYYVFLVGLSALATTVHEKEETGVLFC